MSLRSVEIDVLITQNRLKALLALLAGSSLATALIASGNSYQKSEVIDAGPLATWVNQFSNLAIVVLGLIIVGQLVVHGFLVDQDGKFLSTQSISKLKQVGWFSLILTATCIVGSITTLATVLGLPLQDAMLPKVIKTYLWDIAPSRALLISAALALIVAVFARFIRTLNSVAGLTIFSFMAVGYPLLNSHSAALGNHSLAITASVAHGISMSIWVGSVLALVPFIKSEQTEVIIRFSKLATACVGTLLISGIVSAGTRMAKVSDLLSSGYGILVTTKVLLFGLIAVCASKVRKNLAVNGKALTFVVWELLIMASAVGVGVALHFAKPTRESIPRASAAEDLLGFDFPPAPTIGHLIWGWYPDWLFISIVFVGAWLYIVGLIRLNRNQIKWPIGRTIAFFAGAALLVWVTCAGIAKYAMVSFSAHMFQHMVLAMLVPIFLVLSAPITLALRALPANSDSATRSARSWIVALLHCRYVQLVSSPVLVLFVFSISLYGIYFTSAFATMMGSHTGHIAMSLHFLTTGLIFCYLVIGVDPAPKQIPYWAKLLMVLVSLSIHAFFALAIMQSTTSIGESWYRQVRPPWLTDLLSDTHNAGGIAWGIGEVPMVILLVVISIQWANSDQRTAMQHDRAADRNQEAELTAYNQRLSDLHERSKNQSTD